MARPVNNCVIKVHYPINEEGRLEIRKRMGVEYIGFIKDYILSLPITGKEKNALYAKVYDNLAGKKRHEL